MEQDGGTFPKPSKNIKSNSLDDIVVLITAYPELFKEQYENKKVRINVTIPNKLKQIAQAEKNKLFASFGSCIKRYVRNCILKIIDKRKVY